MKADGERPRLDPPVKGEILHESGHTRVTRLLLNGRRLIRKEPLGPDAEDRLRHEAAMLERLRGVEGIAQPLVVPGFPGSLVMEDVGGTSLAELAKPWPADDLISLAVALGRAIAGMHRREVMHCDIAPANIVLSDTGAPCLIDFALATSLAEIRPEFTPQAEILGTLAYLAPEQTGRTGRPVDQRADLYALGATLYELATGEPPFGTGDPLRLIHDHLARAPVAPDQVNNAVPAPLSEIIMHLLEKEPDNRYQTAAGVIYDLEQLAGRQAHEGARSAAVGERDFPLRLVPPARLVGRDDEAAMLVAAFEAALTSRCRGVLVSGAPGVGKTVLADELRPVVTSRDGWFVAGKFDAYRRDLEFDAAIHAFRALGRLLLAEADDELARVRGRIMAAVGPNAGLLAAALPEFATLLAVSPDPGDPLTAQTRLQRAAVTALRAVASPMRPVVVFLDDLQWAGPTPLGLVDLVLTEDPIDGLLLVGAYRDDDVDAAHPLPVPLSRWLEQATVQHLRLGTLAGPSLATMVAEMLRVDRAAGLAGVIEPYTRGNPYETVELLNALRRDGLLTATASGWRWDEAAVRAHLGRSELAELLAARAAVLPAESRQVAEAMACLGGRAELRLLQAATGEPADMVDRALAPALGEGVVVAEPGAQPAVRFGHDRIREGILTGLDPPRRRDLQLAIARRLAAVPELFAVAAGQYLPVAGAVDDAAERGQVVDLLRRAAGQEAMIGDYALANELLAAALPLIGPGEEAALVAVRTSRHAALFCLGRLEEADEEYQKIEGLCSTVMHRADATAVQVLSLTHRTRFADAIGLGIGALRELGVAVPAAAGLRGEIDRQLDPLFRRLDHTDTAAELRRTEISDPALLAEGRLLSALVPAAYFSGDHTTFAWLALEALRVWMEHGPGPTLVGPASYIATAAITLRGDYVRAYQAARRILALAEAHGYEPATSLARMEFAIFSCWCEPVEKAVRESRQAREGLIAGGNLSYAGYTYYLSATALLDCAPSLDLYLAEVEAGLAFLRRTGDEQTISMLDSSRWLAGVLRGEGAAATAEAAFGDRYAGNPLALFHAHVTRAVAAAIFGDAGGLARHSAAAMPLLPAALGQYVTAVAHQLRALALAAQARDANGDERAGLLAELGDVTRWLAARAVAAPGNFLHLLRLVEAERAWADGDFRAAALAFDAAQREVAERPRPWHRALIVECAGRFYLAHGAEQAGCDLLAQARQQYAAWGATAKVEQLDWAYPFLRQSGPAAGYRGAPPGDLPYRRSALTTGTIDLLGIVSASRVLSSETSVERLHARVVEVLSAMTGATGVHLLPWDEDRQGWLLPVPDTDGGIVPVRDTGQENAAPMSVLRYVQRMREPLVVADAAGDDRFARDPYFTNITCCSLLAVPVLNRGTLRAVLLLENRLLRGAFTTARLEVVNLIAGQLAVSLDNAQLYAGFRRIASEQAALRRVAMLVARGVPPQEIFAAVAREVGLLLTVDFTFLVRYDPQELEVVGLWSSSTDAPVPTPVGGRLPLGGRNITTLVWQTGQPTRIEYDDTISGVIGHVAAGDWGLRSSVGVPVQVDSRPWGSIVVAFTGKERLPPDTEERLAGFTELVATAIANANAQAALTASRARVVTAADHARRRIERDLHDGTQQRLVSLALQLRALQGEPPPEPGALAAELDRCVAEINSALGELQETARGIHPAILAEHGLLPALRALARRCPVPVQVRMHADGRLPEPVEVSAYYVVAEALTNTAKHARASTVRVEAEVTGETLVVVVRDDGAGGADVTGGSGLAGLKDRVEAIGGRLLLDSPRGEGTVLRVEFPI